MVNKLNRFRFVTEDAVNPYDVENSFSLIFFRILDISKLAICNGNSKLYDVKT